MPTCSIRQDLIQQDVFVPLLREGGCPVYIRTSKPLEYRYVNPDTSKETFQVKYYNEWLDGNSKDFEF